MDEGRIDIPDRCRRARGNALLAELLLRSGGASWWHALLGALYVVGLVAAIRDETQPYVEGANDNASAISVLLCLAHALARRPLRDSDVTLLFTGCEEVGCVGLATYLERERPTRDDSYWIDLEIVGQGRTCYITRHGISYLAEYRPHPELVDSGPTGIGCPTGWRTSNPRPCAAPPATPGR